jgi:hypothetical protein
MDKEKIIEKTAESLKPFETENLMKSLQTLTLDQIFTNPYVLLVIAAVLFFGVYRKSKIVLLTLFGLIGLIVLARFTLPPPGQELSLKSVFPFALCGVGIGGVIIYFSLIKDD